MHGDDTVGVGLSDQAEADRLALAHLEDGRLDGPRDPRAVVVRLVPQVVGGDRGLAGREGDQQQLDASGRRRLDLRIRYADPLPRGESAPVVHLHVREGVGIGVGRGRGAREGDRGRRSQSQSEVEQIRHAHVRTPSSWSRKRRVHRNKYGWAVAQLLL